MRGGAGREVQLPVFPPLSISRHSPLSERMEHVTIPLENPSNGGVRHNSVFS